MGMAWRIRPRPRGGLRVVINRSSRLRTADPCVEYCEASRCEMTGQDTAGSAEHCFHSCDPKLPLYCLHVSQIMKIFIKEVAMTWEEVQWCSFN